MKFSNDLDKFEQTILDDCYNMLLSLFDDSNKEKITNKLNKQSKKIYNSIKKIINKENNLDSNYLYLYELIKYLSIPDFDFVELYNKGAKKLVYSGLVIEEKTKDKYNYYGESFNEIGLILITNVCLLKKYNNDEIKCIDDLLFNSNWLCNKNQFNTIIRLIVFAMNNEFNKPYRNINHIIDTKINLRTNKGYLYQTVPVNDFLYGLIYDGLYTEKQFDKYSSGGTYKLLCEKIDDLFNDVINNDKLIDNNIVKEIIITIAAMFNNKMYYLEHYKVIDKETKKRMIHDFNIIFKQNIKEYKLEFNNEDLLKINELVNKSKQRLEN